MSRALHVPPLGGRPVPFLAPASEGTGSPAHPLPQPLSSPHIVLVEDDAEIRTLVADFLGAEEFTVSAVADGIAMDRCLAQRAPDLIILDLMLPGENGLSICQRVRAQSTVPIVFLTAKGDEIDKVVGLEVGADDYLVKPFSPRELLARVRATLRRVAMGRVAMGRVAMERIAMEHGAIGHGAIGQTPPHPVSTGSPSQPTAPTLPIAGVGVVLAFDRFEMDLEGRQIRDTDGLPLSLTSAEFDLLACLVRNARRVLSRDQILDRVHGRSAAPFDRTIDVLISRLRRKLEAASPGSALIATVRNGGYLFTAQVHPVP